MTQRLQYQQIARYPGVIQEARPESDVTTGGWEPLVEGAANADMIDEVHADDSDFTCSPDGPSGAALTVSLTGVQDPNQHDGHVVHYRYAKKPADGPAINLTVELLQGAVVIATWTHLDIPATVQMAHQALTLAEAANITDYTALRLRFTATQP